MAETVNTATYKLRLEFDGLKNDLKRAKSLIESDMSAVQSSIENLTSKTSKDIISKASKATDTI